MMMFYKEKDYKVFRSYARLNMEDQNLLQIADKVYELWYWTKSEDEVRKGLKKEFGDILDNYEILFYPEMIIVKDKYPIDSWECEAVKIVLIDFSHIIWKVRVAIDTIRYEEKKKNYKIEIDTNHAGIMAMLDWLQETLENIDDWTPGEDKLEVQVNKEGGEIELNMNDFRMKIKPY
jgi:hypothetical protein